VIRCAGSPDILSFFTHRSILRVTPPSELLHAWGLLRRSGPEPRERLGLFSRGPPVEEIHAFTDSISPHQRRPSLLPHLFGSLRPSGRIPFTSPSCIHTICHKLRTIKRRCHCRSSPVATQPSHNYLNDSRPALALAPRSTPINSLFPILQSNI